MTVITPPPIPSEAMRPAVAIILVNWNNWRDTVECIDSALGLDYPDFHLFVVDNDSQDDSVGHIARWCESPATVGSGPSPKVRRWSETSKRGIACRRLRADSSPEPDLSLECRVTIVQSAQNTGFAGGCNIGMRTAGLERFGFFWFLNTDTVVERDALAALVERGTRGDNCGMVGSTTLYYDHPDIVQAQAGAWLNMSTGESRHIGEGERLSDTLPSAAEVESQLGYIFGASMLVSRELVRRIGPMQDDYFLYYEEVDWAMRSRQHFRLGYAEKSIVYHKSGNSSSKTMPLFSANLYYRNRIRFMSRFLPHAMNDTKRLLMITMAKCLIKGQWPQAKLLAGILMDADRLRRDAIKPDSKGVHA